MARYLMLEGNSIQVWWGGGLLLKLLLEIFMGNDSNPCKQEQQHTDA